MRNILFVVFIFLFTNSFSQNTYTLVRASKALEGIVINRATITYPKHLNSAYNAILTQTNSIDVSRIQEQIILQTQIQQSRCHPMEVVGGYNYLRTVSKGMAGCEGWGRIRQGGGYNGAHHIISKSTLDVIFKQRKEKTYLNYSDFQRNAPAIFHPFHNNKNFEHLFHDSPRQLELYNKGGVSYILSDFFFNINEINRRYGLPEYAPELINRSFIEAKFWADTYGLRWK